MRAKSQMYGICEGRDTHRVARQVAAAINGDEVTITGEPVAARIVRVRDKSPMCGVSLTAGVQRASLTARVTGGNPQSSGNMDR